MASSFQTPTGRLIHSNMGLKLPPSERAVSGFKPQRAASSIPTWVSHVMPITVFVAFQTPTGRLIHSNCCTCSVASEAKKGKQFREAGFFGFFVEHQKGQSMSYLWREEACRACREAQRKEAITAPRGKLSSSNNVQQIVGWRPTPNRFYFAYAVSA